jgi:isoamylase
MTKTNLIGQSYPFGAAVVDGGINFSVFSRITASFELLLFDRADVAKPARVLRIDPVTNRTYHYWHTGGKE